MLLIITAILIGYSIFCKLKNKKIKNTMVLGCIFGIIGLIIFFPFAGLMYEDWLYSMQPKQYSSSITIYELGYEPHDFDEPPFYINITEQEMEEFPNLKDGIHVYRSDEPYVRVKSNREEYLKINKFFEENNYKQPIFYIKYQNKYYKIEAYSQEIVKC